MSDLIVEEELCVQHRSTWEPGGWAQEGLLADEDVCSESLHQCARLTERLRVSYKGTGMAHPQHAGHREGSGGSEAPSALKATFTPATVHLAQKRETGMNALSSNYKMTIM